MKNYHTHTKLCKHAVGMPKDYCEVAMMKGFTELGFSDHTPLPDELMPHIRMNTEELPVYISEVNKCKECFPELKIFLGLECDYMPRYERYYKDYIVGAMQVEYLIGSVHYYNFQGEVKWFDGKPLSRRQYMIYADLYVKAMESGLFAFMAHPDLYCCCVQNWNGDATACARTILTAAEALKMPLEINTSGITKAKEQNSKQIFYPREEFWGLASEYDIRVIVNSDAHAPQCLNNYFEEADKLIYRYGLKRQENSTEKEK